MQASFNCSTVVDKAITVTCNQQTLLNIICVHTNHVC